MRKNIFYDFIEIRRSVSLVAAIVGHKNNNSSDIAFVSLRQELSQTQQSFRIVNTLPHGEYMPSIYHHEISFIVSNSFNTINIVQEIEEMLPLYWWWY